MSTCMLKKQHIVSVMCQDGSVFAGYSGAVGRGMQRLEWDIVVAAGDVLEIAAVFFCH